jgi:hypothetical protein
MEFDAYRDLALSTLDRARNNLRDTIPTGDDELQFRLTDLSDPDGVNDVVDRLRSRLSAPACVIYCFELLDASGYRVLKTRFQAAASHCEYSGRKLKYSRLSNEENPAALYVGSSKSFRSRFSQHLGLTGGSETYAMRLNQWASWDPLDVKLSLWFFSSDIDPWTLELLEQALWDAKRPLLGKRSGR